MNKEEHDGLQKILTQNLESLKSEQGETFDIEKVNLAELERRTGISRQRLRSLKKNGFVIKPHANTGRKKAETVLSGFTGLVNSLLGQGVTNSSVILERLTEAGYQGGLTQVKEYISSHRNLVPAKRMIVAAQGNRGRRYRTDPGEAYQMDWGFAEAEDGSGRTFKVACFAMICHHCGERFVEFFPNAKQENLFIGMLHAFGRMGVPHHVLTDNMKSVTTGRDTEGHPLWNREYDQFMETVGFETKLCKPRHPFTKGTVERLVRFVKGNFIAGRTFSSITELNYQALQWCTAQNGRYHQCVDCIPHEEHAVKCMGTATLLQETAPVRFYRCPERKISFDGFVNYEGRRFGVPYWYTERTCRVMREDFTLTIYSVDLSRKLTEHDVTWSRKDSFCEGQYASEQPEEFPTSPVNVRLKIQESVPPNEAFARFDFGKEANWDE